MNQQELETHQCEKCSIAFTREKGYYADNDNERLCYCCNDGCHYISEEDVEYQLMRDADMTDSGIWVRHILCRYCHRALSIEFKMDDTAYDNGNKKDVSIVLGEAE